MNGWHGAGGFLRLGLRSRQGGWFLRHCGLIPKVRIGHRYKHSNSVEQSLLWNALFALLFIVLLSVPGSWSGPLLSSVSSKVRFPKGVTRLTSCLCFDWLLPNPSGILRRAGLRLQKVQRRNTRDQAGGFAHLVMEAFNEKRPWLSKSLYSPNASLITHVHA
ncbi:hypothetical protein B0T24DRAFT_315782 [Lasiosphaeria ovina]|uniref:Uncharacterized protein n=1 Tax=Lasiosphaeria ovina TaxID=92902 RepID=A0AAE0K862_9PEZI|nr:hypothetical protein B0T24DRAFT_315782 [Lasiosphaeria ovina]